MSTPSGFDPVLSASPPDLDEPAVLRIAAQTFGVEASSARDLGSERDRTFLLHGSDGAALAVMKLSNAAEDPATLDMEALAVVHAATVDPALPLALPWRVPGQAAGDRDPGTFRATIEHGRDVHHVRMYDVLPGRQRSDPRDLDDAALIAWGETTARLGLALRGFFHPAAQRTMLWDIQHASRTRSMTEAVRDRERRALVERVLDRFDAVLAPAWGRFRAQVVHTDLTTDNALVDARGRITGIVDFGDASHTALIVDLAGVLDSLLADRGGDERFRVARLVVDGYEHHVPLEPIERLRLGEVLATRAAVTIAISSWRTERGLEDPAFAERYNDAVAATIEAILTLGWDEVARRFGADVPLPADARAGLAARRAATMGPALEPLSYETPIHLAEAHGVWLTDVDGRRYLDAYNNVPVVGHGHPRVTEAIARRARRLNTNLRYLHEDAVALAERLIATMPAGSGLDTVFFVNSGSEANDLAWRLATAATGRRGGACTDHAYHGISEAIAALSPESWQGGPAPTHVATWSPADPDGVTRALRTLDERGQPAAAVILDGVLTSDGYPTVARDTAARWRHDASAAGALWIADEVQGGHGRTGEAMWSFEHLGLVPDLVTLGKPMGNGHPVGAVIARSEIAGVFADRTVFFSTFGGNPVSAAAALAVLDVLVDERVLARTTLAGAALRDALRAAAGDDPRVVEVRGVGLAVGVACSSGPIAAALKEGMRGRGVLIGTTGASGDVLKIRPPLAFTADDVPIVAAAFGEALAALPYPPA